MRTLSEWVHFFGPISINRLINLSQPVDGQMCMRKRFVSLADKFLLSTFFGTLKT